APLPLTLSLHDALPILADHSVLRVIFAAARRVERAVQNSPCFGAVFRMQSREKSGDRNGHIRLDTGKLSHPGIPQDGSFFDVIRSEEHTSELQSPCNLV